MAYIGPAGQEIIKAFLKADLDRAETAFAKARDTFDKEIGI